MLTVTAAVLQSIAVTPANPSVPKGLTQQFTATGTFSDNSTQNLTSQVTWASATTSVATITAAGLATAVATGTSTISATLGGVTGSTVLTVSAAVLQSIAVTPANPSVPKGLTEQFTATGHLLRQLDAEPDQPGDLGLGHDLRRHHHRRRAGHRGGDGHLHASAPRWAAISGSTVLTVSAAVLQSIAVTPANPSVPKGMTQQFTATGHLLRQLDAEPDQPGDLGLGHDLRRHHHRGRAGDGGGDGHLDDQRHARRGQRLDGADGHAPRSSSRSR